MRLSVIVPVYNTKKYLAECVESLLTQNLEGADGFEVILVDDGSPDGAGALCDELAGKDARVRVVHKPNGGLSSARNAGLARATGTWVTFVDSDDTLAPDTFSKALAAAEADSYDVVAYGFNIVDESGAQPVTLPAFEVHSTGDLAKVFMEYTSTHALFGSACNKLYRRDFLLENHLAFHENIKVNEDEPFNFEVLAKLSGMAYLNDCLYNYHMRQNASITRKGSVTVYEAALLTQPYAEAFFEAVPALAGLKDEYLKGRSQRALFNQYNQLTGVNALSFSQRRAALREVARTPWQRAYLRQRLKGQPGAGPLLGRLCLGLRWPGLLALISHLRSRAAR